MHANELLNVVYMWLGVGVHVVGSSSLGIDLVYMRYGSGVHVVRLHLRGCEYWCICGLVLM